MHESNTVVNVKIYYFYHIDLLLSFDKFFFFWINFLQSLNLCLVRTFGEDNFDRWNKVNFNDQSNVFSRTAIRQVWKIINLRKTYFEKLRSYWSILTHINICDCMSNGCFVRTILMKNSSRSLRGHHNTRHSILFRTVFSIRKTIVSKIRVQDTCVDDIILPRV